MKLHIILCKQWGNKKWVKTLFLMTALMLFLEGYMHVPSIEVLQSMLLENEH